MRAEDEQSRKMVLVCYEKVRPEVLREQINIVCLAVLSAKEDMTCRRPRNLVQEVIISEEFAVQHVELESSAGEEAAMGQSWWNM
jgi:hypothetical protein